MGYITQESLRPSEGEEVIISKGAETLADLGSLVFSRLDELRSTQWNINQSCPNIGGTSHLLIFPTTQSIQRSETPETSRHFHESFFYVEPIPTNPEAIRKALAVPTTKRWPGQPLHEVELRLDREKAGFPYIYEMTIAEMPDGTNYIWHERIRVDTHFQERHRQMEEETQDIVLLELTPHRTSGERTTWSAVELVPEEGRKVGLHEATHSHTSHTHPPTYTRIPVSIKIREDAPRGMRPLLLTLATLQSLSEQAIHFPVDEDDTEEEIIERIEQWRRRTRNIWDWHIRHTIRNEDEEEKTVNK